ncbi:MAG: hypothetical protein AAGF31_03485 [Planctomycetota bacterium]
MEKPPGKLEDAAVLCFAILDESISRTGNTTHIVGGKDVEAFNALAIGKCFSDRGVYLFYCDSFWQVMTDTYHDTIEVVKQQAEYEYTNLAWLGI